MRRPTFKATKAALAAVTLVAAASVPLAVPSPAFAWSCSDGLCHAISHRSPDDGYDMALVVKCGNNLVQYSINEGQNSQALGCNDVNQILVRAGHSVNCYFDGLWWESWENPTGTSYWSTANLGTWGQGMTYLCVDAWGGTITGGGGGGGGGGGTW